jgi:RND family efflux transporter MFP subunit
MILKRGSIIVAAAALALWAAGARAQERGFDCVIEPYIVVDLGSAADGVIEEMLVSRGDRVTVGQPVARLESGAERAALRIAVARANEYVRIDLARNQIALIEKEAERTQKLAAKKLTALNILETVMSQLAQAQLELQLAEYQRNLAVLEKLRTEAELERRIVRSPIDGVVMRRLIGPGEYAYSQVQIVRIAKIDPLHVEVFLPTELYPSLSVGEEAQVWPAEPVGGEYAAKIIAIDRVFDAASDTFGVRLSLPNPGDHLPAGVDCRVEFR